MAIDYASEISELTSKLASIEAVLNPDGMRKEADDLRERSADPGLWEDQDNAQAIFRRLSYLDAELARLEGLHGRLDDLSIMFELAEREDDEPTMQETLRELESDRALRLLGHRHSSRFRLDWTRHRRARGTSGRRAGWILERHFRKCRGADHCRHRALQGPDQRGQGVDHRIDHREHSARSRPVHFLRRDQDTKSNASTKPARALR